MIYAMTCADDNYIPSARFHLKTAIEKGKVDKTILYHLKDIDEEFKRNNLQILNSGEGRRKGFYLWKPYFVNKAINSIESGDFLIYLDSAGFYYRHSVKEIIDYMIFNNIDMIGTRRFNYLEKHWTRRDTFVYMGCDTPEYTEQRQAMGGCFVLKKTPRTESIIQEWLAFAQQYQIIAEAPNTCGLDNYEGFVEHRHDQSIFSILQKKYNVLTIEETPVPDFYVYHHTMETSIRNIKKELRIRRWQQIKKCIEEKNWKGIIYLERERIYGLSVVQRRLRRVRRQDIEG